MAIEKKKQRRRRKKRGFLPRFRGEISMKASGTDGAFELPAEKACCGLRKDEGSSWRNMRGGCSGKICQIREKIHCLVHRL